MTGTATCITARSRRTCSEYVPDRGNVMDYGCGEATSADLVAERAGHLSLVEAASTVRDFADAAFRQQSEDFGADA